MMVWESCISCREYGEAGAGGDDEDEIDGC